MRAIVAAILLAPVAAQGAPLICEVNTPSTYAQGSPVQILINVDTQTGRAEFHTLSELVEGTVKVSDGEFSGTVTGASGQRYWLSIDRYTGTLALTKEGHVSGQKAEMWGECRAAKQKF
ncbi:MULTISPECIES: hypothetical protein [Stenotrophomonas]|uniref:hypothetical protein n=1 Tax=Stenotrophomonas TaxID=40323 RepID=UPI00114C9117|nr:MULTISPECIES: hypothetical protein [Stenotrophomonas]